MASKMPPGRRIRDPYRTPSPTPLRSAARAKFVQTAPENDYLVDGKLILYNSQSTEIGVGSGGNRFDENGSLAITPNTSPLLSETPSSIDSLAIQTPKIQGRSTSQNFPDALDFGPRALDTFMLNEGNFSTPIFGLHDGLNNLLEEIGQLEKPPKDLPQTTLDNIVQQQNAREACPTISECQITQVAHPSTPQHQIIRIYSQPNEEPTSGESQSHSLIRHRQSENSLNDHATSLLSLPTVVKADIDQQGEHMLSRDKILVLSVPEKPDISAWLLRSERSSSRSDTDSICSFESDITYDAVQPYSSTEKHGCIEPLEYQASPRDFLQLTRNNISHLPDYITRPLLTSLQILFESWGSQLSIIQAAADSTIPPSSFNGPLSGSGTGNSTSSLNNKKRDSDNGDDDRSHLGIEDSRKKQKISEECNKRQRQKWACPYYQREPHRFCVVTESGDFRKCARSPGFDQVHRVKDHIYKCHSPKYCDRCFAVFKEEQDLQSHRRSYTPCELKAPQPVEGLNTEQKALLKPRDRKSKSDEERWNTIYRICFPQDVVLPSPFYVHYSQEVAELRREILSIIQWETQSPNEIDVTRLRQRVDGAFRTQMLANNPSSSIPRTPSVLTPSTSNDSSRSTDLSLQIQTREIYAESPRVKNASEKVVLTTDSRSAKLSSNELAKPSALLRPSSGPPLLPLTNTCLPNDNEGVAQSVENLPIPFRDFKDDAQMFNLEPAQFGIESSDPFDPTSFELNSDGYEAWFNDYAGSGMTASRGSNTFT